MSGKNPFHLIAKDPVESESSGSHGIFRKEKPAISEEPSQDLLLLRSEGIKLILSCHVKERAEEEFGIGEGCDSSLFRAINAGPELHLFNDRFHELGIGIPFPSPVSDLCKKEMGKGSVMNNFRSLR
jgi:hypothetical protein